MGHNLSLWKHSGGGGGDGSDDYEDDDNDAEILYEMPWCS
jgi:hypothetical protein